MELKHIKRVSIEFEDGTTKEVELPNPGQGFYRESYTWEDREGHKWNNRINVFEIFWTERVDSKEKVLTNAP